MAKRAVPPLAAMVLLTPRFLLPYWSDNATYTRPALFVGLVTVPLIVAASATPDIHISRPITTNSCINQPLRPKLMLFIWRSFLLRRFVEVRRLKTAETLCW